MALATNSSRVNDAFVWTGDTIGRIERRVSDLEKRGLTSNVSRYSRSRSNRVGCCCNPLKIIVSNHLQHTVSKTVSPDVWDTMPLENILSPDRAEMMETKSRSQHVMNFTFDRPRLFNAFAMPYHTMGPWGKVRLRLFDRLDQVVYDSGWFLARDRKPLSQIRIWEDRWGANYNDNLPQSAPHYFDSVRAIRAEITLFDKSHSQWPDYFDISMLFLGLSWSPRFNFDYGITLSVDDFVTHAISAGKTRITEGTRGFMRRLQFQLSWLDETDENLFADFLYGVGQGGEFFVSAYPNHHNNMIESEFSFVGRFEGIPTRTHATHQQWQAPVVIGEI